LNKEKRKDNPGSMMNNIEKVFSLFSLKEGFSARLIIYMCGVLLSLAILIWNAGVSRAEVELPGFKKVMRGSVLKQDVNNIKFIRAYLFEESLRKYHYRLLLINSGSRPLRLNYFNDKLYIVGKNKKEYIPRVPVTGYPRILYPQRLVRIYFYFSDLPIEEVDHVVVIIHSDHTKIVLKEIPSTSLKTESDDSEKSLKEVEPGVSLQE
jgi:hypothetical protein